MMVLPWRQPTADSVACHLCGKRTRYEACRTLQSEPTALAHWFPLCYRCDVDELPLSTAIGTILETRRTDA